MVITIKNPVKNIFGGYKEMTTSRGVKYRWCYILKVEKHNGKRTRPISEREDWVKVG
jgi:hypothetical protein